MKPFADVSLRVLILALIVFAAGRSTGPVLAREAVDPPPAPAPQAAVSLFRKPVVPGATISGYFDHSSASGYVTFYDGQRNNSPAYGFRFTCGSPYMNDFVGCVDNVSGIDACSPSRQLWYDNHHGTDYEYSPNWYTGAVCDPGSFGGLTHPVYAPARGKVVRAGEDPNRANGWSILMKFDANKDGNFDNDNLRAFFLHFTANQIAVYAGQVVEENQYLGLGGSTGYSSSPHLHFEVQRSADGYNWYPVDPYGWEGGYADPWGYTNVSLWQKPIPIPDNLNNKNYLPVISYQEACPGGCQRLANRDFEQGHSGWAEKGVQIIASTAEPNLRVQPFSGSWLAWLGGRYNATDGLSQGFNLPDNTLTGHLVYRVYLDGPVSGNDRMTVSLRDSTGSVIQTLDQIDSGFTTLNQWVERAADIGDLSPWRGQTVELSVDAVTGGGSKTSFYVDDFAFELGQ